MQYKELGQESVRRFEHLIGAAIVVKLKADRTTVVSYVAAVREEGIALTRQVLYKLSKGKQDKQMRLYSLMVMLAVAGLDPEEVLTNKNNWADIQDIT